MKKLVLVLALVSSSVFASEEGSSSGSSSTATASPVVTNTNTNTNTATASPVITNTNTATATGGAASITSPTSVTTSISSGSVPNVYAPNLSTTLTETCMGSTSAGASGIGFGASFGTTWTDETCIRRLDARQLAALGEVDIAKELMCRSDEVREAAKRAGRPCKEEE